MSTGHFYVRLAAVLGCVFLPAALAAVAGGQSVPRRPAVTALAVTPNGKGLVVGSQAGVSYRRLGDKSPQPIPTKLDHVHAVAFAPGGKVLAVAGGSPAESGAVELLSWPGRQALGRLEGHTDSVHDVAWLDGGKRLATAGADRMVRLWDISDAKCIKQLVGHSGPVLALAASPDGKWLCSGSADQTIRVWRTADGSLVRSLDNHLGPVQALAFRPGVADGRPAYLASGGGDGTVRIWQPAIGRMVRIVRHPAPVHALGWSPDGGRLHTGSKDGMLRIVDADSDAILGERRASKDAIVSLAVAPGEERIVLGDVRGALTFFDAPK